MISTCTYLFLFIILILARDTDAQSVFIVIETEKGNITLELETEKAPVTCANFLHYADRQLYDGASFYRSVKRDHPSNPVSISVIQGGLDKILDVDSLPPIAHESTLVTGIKHLDGTVSMARYGPGTATSEFFICVGDQPELDFGGKRNPDGYGFAAFGRVTEGFEVIQAIHQQETEGDFQYLVKPVMIRSIYRLEKKK